MKTITLHGVLADKFTKDKISLDASTPHDIVRGLIVNFGQEFEQIIRKGSWHFIAGTGEAAKYLDVEDLMFTSSDTEYALIPVIEGSGSIGKIILGVALIAVAIWQPWSTAAMGPAFGIAGATASAATAGFTVLGMTVSWSTLGWFGASIALSGVAELFAGSPKIGNYSSQERPDDKPSFMFNSPVNTSTQGQPVPIVYGRFRTGSYVVSAGVEIEELPV